MNDLPPIPSPTGAPISPPVSASSEVDLLALARTKKWVLWCGLANITALIFTLVAENPSLLISVQTDWIRTIFEILLRVVVGIGTALAVWNLGRALRYNSPWLPALLLTFFSIAPCVNMIALLVLNARATTKLQEGGYRVGLMGAKRHDV